MKPEIEFIGWPKIARFSREVVVTEKLDGTNAQVYIDEADNVFAGSRTRWITPEDDNYGFAKWVQANRKDLLRLGHGHHFGEWWGAGIQRKYGLTEKRFSLFNTSVWGNDAIRPACCGVTPILYQGDFSDMPLEAIMADLKAGGSVAAPGFMQPEGVVIFHTAARMAFKKTFERDEGKDQ